jgi:hypothetical protein
MISHNLQYGTAGHLLKKCFHVHGFSSCKETMTSKDLESDSLLYCHFMNYRNYTTILDKSVGTLTLFYLEF